jgi:hypothetical protein
VVFLLREHFRSLGLGKAGYWPLVVPINAARGILNQTEQSGLSLLDKLKS